MSFPEVGLLAPNFSLLNQRNEMVELSTFKNRCNVVVYFYPKAATPGCTTQACGIRDYRKRFEELNTIVLGVSPDSPKKLQQFDVKYELGYELLADEGHLVAESYGVWGLKKFMGKEFMGVLRTSFIINTDGILVHIIDKVNTKTHNDVLVNYIGKGI